MTHKQRQQRRDHDQDTRRYDFLRIWKRRYYHMVSRNEGRSTNRSNAQGKEIITQEVFLIWCKDFDNLQNFLTLYFEWASANFPLHLAPSIDRIDPSKGYVLNNIQWMSFSDNCEKNNRDPFTGKRLT
jgi:hypothetical protein